MSLRPPRRGAGLRRRLRARLTAGRHLLHDELVALSGGRPRRLGAILLLVLVPALVLRFWAASSLWLDEAQSLAIARQSLPELLGALRSDGAPPLYYLLLRGWTGLFGTSDLALRSLSGIFSVLALPLMWWAGRRVGGARDGRRLGLVALLVLAANPWAIRYATEARMYALLALLVLLAGYALDRAYARGTRRDVVVLGIAAGLLLLTHYWAFFLYAVTTAGLVVLARSGAPAERRARARRALRGLVLGGALFLPWLPSFLFQVRHTGAPWADPPGLVRLATLPLEWSGNDVPTARWVVLLFWPLLLLGVAGGALRRSWAADAESDRVDAEAARRPLGALPRLERAGRLLAAGAGGTLLLALVVTRLTGSGVEVRYTAVVVPLVLLLIALGVLALPRRVAAAVLAALVVLGLVAALESARLPRTQARAVAAALTRFAAPGDVVLYCPDQLAPPVERLLNTPDLQRLPVPYAPTPTIVDWIDYEDRVTGTEGESVAGAAIRRASGGNVWLLTSPRYRTHRELCGSVRTELADRGAQPTVTVPLDPDAYEYAVLERWNTANARSTIRRVPD